MDSDDNVDFEAVIDEKSPINCPFIDYEAVESEDGRKITDFEEEEAIPPCKRGATHIKNSNYQFIFQLKLFNPLYYIPICIHIPYNY